MSTAIFIISCDKTRDVLNHFVLSFNKYWKNQTLPIYLSTNDFREPDNFNNITLISAPKSNWKTETLSQLYSIKYNNPDITHLLVMLDDFILNDYVNNEYLFNLISFVETKKIQYLRLKRLEDCFFYKLTQEIKSVNIASGEKIFKIRKSHPYYSSLQIALWDIDHLISILNNIDNIWDFELQQKTNYIHYSVVENLFSYKHVVEKGKWETYAKKYCIKYISYFNQGNRVIQKSNLIKDLFFILKKIKFFLFGYLFSKKFLAN